MVCLKKTVCLRFALPDFELGTLTRYHDMPKSVLGKDLLSYRMIDSTPLLSRLSGAQYVGFASLSLFGCSVNGRPRQNLSRVGLKKLWIAPSLAEGLHISMQSGFLCVQSTHLDAKPPPGHVQTR
jgi:hypothetical protein